MSDRKTFRQFSALPRDVQNDIWRKSLSGLQINFMTMRREPVKLAVVNEIWARLGPREDIDHPEPRTWATFTNALRNYHRSLVSVVHSETDGEGAWGRYSTRIQVQETAATCSHAYESIARVLQRRAVGSKYPDPLCVLMPEREPGNSRLDINYPGSLKMDDLSFGGLSHMDALAILWQPLEGIDRDLQRFRDSGLQLSLRTLYLLDMTRPLRMSAQEIAGLKLNAGPWFGHQFAFVDVEQNPVDNMVEYVKPYSAVDRELIMHQVNALIAALHWRRSPGIALSLSDPPTIKVRILTPILLLANSS